MVMQIHLPKYGNCGHKPFLGHYLSGEEVWWSLVYCLTGRRPSGRFQVVLGTAQALIWVVDSVGL